MPKVPLLSGKEVVSILLRLGYSVVRQRGSHIRLIHMTKKPVTVPAHSTIGRGLLRKILRQAGISEEQFLNKK